MLESDIRDTNTRSWVVSPENCDLGQLRANRLIVYDLPFVVISSEIEKKKKGIMIRWS
jgi:septin family protein